MRDPKMDDVGTRLLLVIMLVGNLFVGLWAAFAPRSFYVSFPGGGRAWVSVDGPYNEHLVRDVGTLYLALAAITIAALVRPTRYLVAVVAGSSLVAFLPHFTYHLFHLDQYQASDKIGQTVSLGIGIVAAIILGIRALKVPTAVDDDLNHAEAVGTGGTRS